MKSTADASDVTPTPAAGNGSKDDAVGHSAPRYRPVDSSTSPRFTGPRTFMRLPHIDTLEDVDVAVLGIPNDDVVSYRSGARFGPAAIRDASILLRPYNPDLGVDISDVLSVVDYPDAPTVPGYHLKTLELIQAHLEPVHAAGVTPIVLGGDHSIALGELRAAAAIHGPLALVHLDSHCDLWDQYYGADYFHGTVFRRAVEEGLIDPAKSVQAGLRGSSYGPADDQLSAGFGFLALPWRELRQLSPEEFGSAVRERVSGAPAFLTFDIDFVDPAFAPGTGTPEVGGPTSWQALSYLRSLFGIDFKGFDCVEVCPPFDPAGVTAWLGASVCFDMLALAALQRGRGAGHGESSPSVSAHE